ncbi:hypothetical protein CASFOL_040674 [Castilleja foliolosa]|uniref:BHLH domain-containing protein n=1 Tax=Castilleja foliolosa TaxID=1961234 RepID=A0ABD3BCA6_9LAMI
MSEEFQGGVCGGNWWINSSTNLFRSSPCSSSINDPSASFGWLNHEPIIDINTTRSKSDDSTGSASDGSIVLHDVQKPSDENVSIFSSSLQTMGFNHSSSSTITNDNWNQNLIHDNIGRSEQNYTNQILQQATSGLEFINSSMNNNYGQNSYSYNNSSSLLQTLFDTDSQTDHQFLLDNNNNQSTIYSSSPSFMNSTEFCQINSKPSVPNNNNLHFTNNTPFWNANFLPSSQPQLALPSAPNSTKPNLHNLTTKQRNQDSAASKKVKNEPPIKRPRIETPSPLPTFKVRKEKLGDRVTALQQLVSPFGKTDTASVLHEAIEYIKFLHDQVLTNPYLKNGSPHLQNHQQAADKNKDEQGQKQDLKSRGLCLVPISSTFPVAAETATDFWTPTFGGCFR